MDARDMPEHSLRIMKTAPKPIGGIDAFGSDFVQFRVKEATLGPEMTLSAFCRSVEMSACKELTE